MAVPWSVAFGVVVMLLALPLPVPPLAVFMVAAVFCWLVLLALSARRPS